jgi:hypothetical protein
MGSVKGSLRVTQKNGQTLTGMVKQFEWHKIRPEGYKMKEEG